MSEKQVQVDSRDIPQKEDLHAIRAATSAVSKGCASVALVSKLCGTAPRATGYALQAARIIGLIEESEEGYFITERGVQLLTLEEGTPDEASAYRNAIDESAPIRMAVGDLFEIGLDIEKLTARIQSVTTQLSPRTAARRAASLLAWRRTILANTVRVAEPKQIELAFTPAIVPQVATASPATDTAVVAPEPAPLLGPNEMAYFLRNYSRGGVLLFTGAGFSYDALDHDGNRLPVGVALAKELWSLCYGADPFDSNSRLPELFAVGHRTRKRELEALLKRRLTVSPSTLADYYRLWFAAPWRRVYTLNVDDLEQAAALAFDLPRKPQSVSAQAADRNEPVQIPSPSELAIVHLNGSILDGVDQVTFSARQYAERLSNQEPMFAQLASDLLAFPVIFVGSELDEATLWQHIELRGARASQGEKELRPKSFLVSPSLSRPRQQLLEEYNVYWIRATAKDFATSILANSTEAGQLGLAALGALATADRDSADNVHAVSELLARTQRSQTDYLMGAEPVWSDLQSARAIVREVDDEIYKHAAKLVSATGKIKGKKKNTPLMIITGTAGSGKSTSLMRLAMRLSADGHSVGWVGSGTEVSPRTLFKLANEPNKHTVICIDDASRYGASLAQLARDLQKGSSLKLLCVGLRSSHAIALESEELSGDGSTTVTMPYLTDNDVGGLIDTLTREHRLGALKGLTRGEQELALKEQAGRQLLVAMIEATSGQRFDEKVLSEWENLPPRPRFYYSLITVASAFHYAISKSELLVATQSSRKADDLAAIDALVDKHIVVAAEGGTRLRSRHTVIAEKLLSELQKRGTVLSNCCRDLAFSVATKVHTDMPRNAREWRFLKSILNNRQIFRLLGLDGARDVYQAVESLLHWDYHYLLQRGAMEVKEGDIRLAENFLNQAHGLNSSDPLVVTEFAYMRMRKAMTMAGTPEAESTFDQAAETLRNQITARGRQDSYPYHVLGSQTIAWVKRSGATRDEKTRMLKEVQVELQKGVAEHPRAKDLVGLAKDIQREILQLALK